MSKVTFVDGTTILAATSLPLRFLLSRSHNSAVTQAAEDHIAITAVLYRYCELLDERNPSALVSEVYASHAEDDRKRGTPRRGEAELVSYFSAALDLLEATVHLLSNVTVHLSGDIATASSRVQACHWFAATAALGPVRASECVLVARYDDELARLPQGWRITRRRVTACGPGGLLAGRMPAVFSGFGGITSGGPDQD